MQSEDGGWAAFDVDNNWAVLNHVPFADHNAMLDPTCPDITGRVLECLCRRGFARSRCRAARRGYLLQAQEKDGSWYGRWGVNYIYGSFLAMRGLAAAQRGAGRARRASRRAANWLRRDSESPTADGARAAPATISDRFRGGRQLPVANRVGHARVAGGRSKR